MEDTIALNEAAVEEINREKKKCHKSALKSLRNLQELLNGSDDLNSEEQEAAAALETVAQV